MQPYDCIFPAYTWISIMNKRYFFFHVCIVWASKIKNTILHYLIFPLIPDPLATLIHIRCSIRSTCLGFDLTRFNSVTSDYEQCNAMVGHHQSPLGTTVIYKNFKSTRQNQPTLPTKVRWFPRVLILALVLCWLPFLRGFISVTTLVWDGIHVSPSWLRYHVSLSLRGSISVTPSTGLSICFWNNLDLHLYIHITFSFTLRKLKNYVQSYTVFFLLMSE